MQMPSLPLSALRSALRLSILHTGLTAAAAGPLGAAVSFVDQHHAAAEDSGPGSSDRPFKTLGRAVRTLAAGDTVLIRSGSYRESLVIAANGEPGRPIVIAADTGAHVVLTGADILHGAKPDAAGRISLPWPHRFPHHPNDARHALIGRCEQVFVDRYPLHQVADPAAVVPGTFCAEQGRLTLQLPFVPPPKSPPLLEASVRPELLRVSGSHVVVRGLRFRYAANGAQQAMALFAGNHGVVEDCTFERSNGVGAGFRATDLQVLRCAFLENGQLGFSANHAHHLLLRECVVRGNNAKNFSRHWEAGGNKLVLCRGVVLERCQFLGNRGFGAWFDIGNEACTVRHCLFADNEDAGLFYEISYGLHTHDNVFIGNGHLADRGAWGADGAISLSSSPGCLIERNLMVGNKEGFQLREQLRTTARIAGGPEVAVWNHDQAVRRNFYAHNQLQVGGHFDVKDERHWPATRRRGAVDSASAPVDLAAGYQAREEQGQPHGLSLDQLRLALTDNLFAQHPGQASVRWGVPWRRHSVFSEPARAATELPGIETRSRLVDAPFANPAARDFRLPAGHPAHLDGCYPRGEVPGVRLGTSEP
jgi:hypothetical protein